MKRLLFVFQILLLTVFISSESEAIEATNVNIPSSPSRGQNQALYPQLAQDGNFYTKNHEWLKNGTNHIQVGISFFMAGAIGHVITVITPILSVDDTFVKGALLAEIVGANGTTELHAPCDGVIKGINPVVLTPAQMAADQVWVYKCELKRDQLGVLMNDAEYRNFIK